MKIKVLKCPNCNSIYKYIVSKNEKGEYKCFKCGIVFADNSLPTK